jgi:predicted nucleic acid-binding protein
VRFVDTSFWVALASSRDRHHDDAHALAAAGAGPLVTTNHVVGETWTFVRRRHGHASAVACLRAIRGMRDLAVKHVDATVEEDAWRWLQRRDEREYSFVDATSFALMRQSRIREALAFDGDFSAAGFVELRPPSV